jgi:hypothetical protein
MDRNLSLAQIRSRAIMLAAVAILGALFAVGAGATLTHASASGDAYPAKLEVLRAGVEDGRLDVLADITKRADGDRVRVSFIANGKRFRFTAPVDDGSIRFKRLLPSSQRGMSTGIMEISYEGNDRVRPTEVRLRAANGKAGLQRDLLSLHNGVITARGSLTGRAHGVVRLILSYERPNGTVGDWQGRASVRDDGSWRLEENLPADARAGGYLSIQFTGYYPRRVRGEQLAKQLLDGQTFDLPKGTSSEPAPAGDAVARAPVSVPAVSDPPTGKVPESSIPVAPLPAPGPGGKATLRPVGSVILSDADAASRVKRSSFEPRAGNATANQKVPTSAELGRFRTYSPDWGECAEKFKPYITGNFTGTTDEQIQRVAHKWGIDEDIVRAVAVKESYWNQDARGDWDPNTQNYMSYGLTQVRRNSRGESAPNWDGTFPLSRDSTAFNLDFWAASVRQYYEGCSTWLNDLGVSYAPGDMWGSVGAWYAGRWYNADAKWYIGEVKTILNNRTWEQTGF